MCLCDTASLINFRSVLEYIIKVFSVNVRMPGATPPCEISGIESFPAPRVITSIPNVNHLSGLMYSVRQISLAPLSGLPNYRTISDRFCRWPTVIRQTIFFIHPLNVRFLCISILIYIFFTERSNRSKQISRIRARQVDYDFSVSVIPSLSQRGEKKFYQTHFFSRFFWFSKTSRFSVYLCARTLGVRVCSCVSRLFPRERMKPR